MERARKSAPLRGRRRRARSHHTPLSRHHGKPLWRYSDLAAPHRGRPQTAGACRARRAAVHHTIAHGSGAFGLCMRPALVLTGQGDCGRAAAVDFRADRGLLVAAFHVFMGNYRIAAVSTLRLVCASVLGVALTITTRPADIVDVLERLLYAAVAHRPASRTAGAADRADAALHRATLVKTGRRLSPAYRQARRAAADRTACHPHAACHAPRRRRAVGTSWSLKGVHS